MLCKGSAAREHWEFGRCQYAISCSCCCSVLPCAAASHSLQLATSAERSLAQSLWQQVCDAPPLTSHSHATVSWPLPTLAARAQASRGAPSLDLRHGKGQGHLTALGFMWGWAAVR